MTVEIPKDSWTGAVQTVTIGATAAEGGSRSHTVTVGGQKALPFMHFEQEAPNPPVVALGVALLWGPSTLAQFRYRPRHRW